MPFSYTENDISEYWSYCGEIESMDMLVFPDTQRFRGLVFITFKTVSSVVIVTHRHAL